MAEYKNIPYGISEYQEIRAEDYLYVDKTRFIAELERQGKYLIFLRPRRFGKTLLVSTLSTYYDKNTADQFEELFGDTYIGAHKTRLANQFYVMRFNFSGLSSESPEKLKETFYQNVVASLEKFIASYQLDVDLKSSDFSEPASLLNAVLSSVYNYTGKQVYIFIDEYDHFANNIIGKQEFFQTITSRNGFVRNFYEVFKAHTEGGCINRIFITGVTSMTLDSLTSGFNIAKNISLRESLNEMVGFTEAETRGLLQQIEIPEEDSIMEILTSQYNGYQFHLEEDDKKRRMFNSNLVLFFMDEYQSQGKMPRSLIDSNIRGDYQKLTNIFELYQDEEDRSAILQKIMAGDCISADIVNNFSFTHSFSRDELLSMLFYMGLLTIEGAGGSFDVRLRTPNAVIRDVYYKYYSDYLHLDKKVKRPALDDIAYRNNFEKFNDMLVNVLKNHNTDDYRGFDEARLKSIFLACLSNQELYSVKSEYQTGGRKIDLVLKDYRAGNTGVKYNYLIELKYLQKSEATESKIQAVQKQAREQMADYLNLEEFQTDGRTKGLIYVVVMNEIVCFEEVAPQKPTNYVAE